MTTTRVVAGLMAASYTDTLKARASIAELGKAAYKLSEKMLN